MNFYTYIVMMTENHEGKNCDITLPFEHIKMGLKYAHFIQCMTYSSYSQDVLFLVSFNKKENLQFKF